MTDYMYYYSPGYDQYYILERSFNQLSTENTRLKGEVEGLLEQLSKLQTENKRLQAENEELYDWQIKHTRH